MFTLESLYSTEAKKIYKTTILVVGTLIWWQRLVLNIYLR